MPSRIVTYVHRPKRVPRKRKAVAVKVPAVVAARSGGNRRRPPPVDDDQPEPAAPPPANDDTPTEPAPPAAKSAIVTTASRKRTKLLRAELPDDPEAEARVKAFLARMVRPP